MWKLSDKLVAAFGVSAIAILLVVFIFGFLESWADETVFMPRMLELCEKDAAVGHLVADRCNEWRAWGKLRPVVAGWQVTRQYVINSPYIVIGCFGVALSLFSYKLFDWFSPLPSYHMTKTA